MHNLLVVHLILYAAYSILLFAFITAACAGKCNAQRVYALKVYSSSCQHCDGVRKMYQLVKGQAHDVLSTQQDMHISSWTAHVGAICVNFIFCACHV